MTFSHGISAESIFLYQRLTKIIAKLTEGVEVEIRKQMDDLNDRARQAAEAMDQLNPHIDRLRDDISGVRSYLSKDLAAALQDSKGLVNDGIEHAQNLQQMLAVMMKTVINGQSEVASAQEQSLGFVTQKANEELGAIMAAMATAVASSMSLQNQIVRNEACLDRSGR